MNKVAAIQKLNKTELELGIAGTSASWHQRYLNCDSIYIGGLPLNVNEEGLLGILEQFGTVIHVNLVRDENTHESKGFAFVRYADPRSCILAVDNFTGFEIEGRTLRVDHAENYVAREGVGWDTAPPELYESKEGGNKSPGENGATSQSAFAEKRRESAVMERLEAMRKRRRGEKKHPSKEAERTDVGQPAPNEEMEEDVLLLKKNRRAEKQERRREKEKRRLERAKVREERAKRRAERQIPS